MNSADGKVFCIPEGYEVVDKSLEDTAGDRGEHAGASPGVPNSVPRTTGGVGLTNGQRGLPGGYDGVGGSCHKGFLPFVSL